MEAEKVRQIFQLVSEKQISVEDATEIINNSGFTDLGFAKIDTERNKRTGVPEIIYGEGKTAEQIIGIVEAMLEKQNNILVTRVDSQKAKEVRKSLPQLHYDEVSEMLLWEKNQVAKTIGKIAIVTAGTSDLKIAEEAAVTAEAFGNSVVRIYDVGVAGIHRLFARIDEIRAAQVVIVIAGMEGALASVVGGLVSSPVIAVPTSVGYGTAFNGMAALLTMLNSCATGITVVNIDNGFGAGYSASKINHLAEAAK
ncbi:nickel pincer cofactor biosynthesis protein LarB [Liquorilactobacillus mali]|uniref:nickel pincer cofactor biosynthesis protein LarB n=1 Tax=Liquorilactobacillus mali TaxID=1618 RepID=UPI0023504617|nr:nickel pincer cofactor biosynthesis protein LarB [Liquorilactobacillus mali]MDC7952600.1 nickel pincer cofactor biosynthesis protein LarB [Liquorilactobacillus mali]MDV7757678.1 nickel pincer cofactor biosynthesis protein LarB [Liquorilactobacillus mali]